MTMTFQELLLLRLEIDALNAEFAYLIDHDQSDRVAELFTEDGVYGRSTGQRSAGRDAIRQSYQRRKDHGVRTARHIFSNLRLTPIADGLVGGTCILTLFAQDGPPPHPAGTGTSPASSTAARCRRATPTSRASARRWAPGSPRDR